MGSTVLILNPTSGSSLLANEHSGFDELERRILAALHSYNVEPQVRYTTPEDDGYEMARVAAEEGAELVIAAGGDGTLHAVASGLLRTQSVLGIVPMGTMNNVARSLGIPENIEEACKVIATGQTGLIDVGLVNDHVFLEVTGIGLEAALFPAAEEIKRYGLLSTLRGVIDGLRTLLTFRSTRFLISFDGRRTRRLRALQISVCNAPYYGARLQFAPEAVMDDGLLDVLIYRNFSKGEYIRHAFSISRGQRSLEPRIIRRKVQSLRVRAYEPVAVHVDGVQQGTTPVLISVDPGVLHVRMPVAP